MSRKSRLRPIETSPLAQGYEVYHYDTVSSTNDVAKELAKRGAKEGIVVLADEQTRGRGRLNRHWISPKGGIWLSIVLRPQISPPEASRITFIASSAVAETLRQLYALDPAVKWPNDVLIAGRKVCGMLTEASTRADIVQFVVVGLGINANVDLQAFPSGVRRDVTTLKRELGHAVEPRTLIKTLLQDFDYRYARLKEGAWLALLREWKSQAAFLHEPVSVAGTGENLLGEAVDIDEDGALLIRLETGVLKRVLAGDLKLRKRI